MNDQLDLRPPPGRTDVKPPPARRRSRWVTPLFGLLLIGIAVLIGWRILEKSGHPQATRQATGAPQSVGVTTIATGDIDVILTGLGAVTPLATVTVQTQISGQLQTIAFTEGQMVHKGDFMAQIDPRPYQAALEQAEGTLAHDTGLLNQARADYARYQKLGRQDSISQQQVEDQQYLIKQYEGSVIADQGTVDTDKLNLTYCHITSPIDGRVGIRLVDPGNYVQTSSSAGLFVITQLQPMSVLFTLPEDDVDEIRTQMAAGSLPVMVYDRSNTRQVASGTLSAIDTQIDNTTGTLKLRAVFPNTDNALFPQSFVNARLQVKTLKGVVVAPEAAIQHGAPGDFVYLVKPDNTVSVQVVKTGASQGTRVQVLEGLKAGDKVVTDGLDRLKDGARISISTPPGTAPPGTAPPGETPPAGRRPHRGSGTQGGPPSGSDGTPAGGPTAPTGG